MASLDSSLQHLYLERPGFWSDVCLIGFEAVHHHGSQAEHICPYMEVEYDLFEEAIDLHDNLWLVEVNVHVVQMADTFPHLAYRHCTWNIQNLATKFDPHVR